jgi:hypothetical protein
MLGRMVSPYGAPSAATPACRREAARSGRWPLARGGRAAEEPVAQSAPLCG